MQYIFNENKTKFVLYTYFFNMTLDFPSLKSCWLKIILYLCINILLFDVNRDLSKMSLPYSDRMLLSGR